jgi:hypothetical protein
MKMEVVTMIYKALIGLGLSLCVAACASAPSAPAARPRATAASQLPRSGCVAQTGSRIQAGPTECTQAGRVWTEDDLKSTGAIDLGKALPLLDSTVSVGH